MRRPKWKIHLIKPTNWKNTNTFGNLQMSFIISVGFVGLVRRELSEWVGYLDKLKLIIYIFNLIPLFRDIGARRVRRLWRAAGRVSALRRCCSNGRAISGTSCCFAVLHQITYLVFSWDLLNKKLRAFLNEGVGLLLRIVLLSVSVHEVDEVVRVDDLIFAQPGRQTLARLPNVVLYRLPCECGFQKFVILQKMENFKY